ncbi:S-layer homology domain-containing protein [Egicoccus sp. AB-alg6-2]|uniref:S-layer homology domain-containing protein n=1 Tax=Egicoccus sp. AB-alg6-2 TaxID=3242692 RepID=UPI00359DC5A2
MRTRRTFRRIVTVVATTSAFGLLSPALGSADGHGSTNHREVPNNGCGTETPVAAFPDRSDASSAHQRNIDCVAHQGVAEGRDGRYHPGERVTRAQMASFVARTLEAAGDRDLPDDPEQRFEDTDGTVHQHRIAQLAEVGIVEGRDANRYEPNAHVTRAQMASYVLRAASWNHTGDIDAYAPAGNDAYFPDAVGSHHADNIRTGYELALLDGRSPGTYAPTDDVHRAAMATFLSRLLDLVHPDAYQTNNQTYVMSPSEPVGTSAGEEIEVTVLASRADYAGDAEPVPGPVRQALHVALLPCDNVDSDVPATFAGDQLAAGVGSTDQGHAYIRDVNGEPVGGQETLVRDVPPEDGRITFTLIADQADCTVAVAFDDRGPQDELRLDAGNRPAHAFGFVVAEWG